MWSTDPQPVNPIAAKKHVFEKLVSCFIDTLVGIGSAGWSSDRAPQAHVACLSFDIRALVLSWTKKLWRNWVFIAFVSLEEISIECQCFGYVSKGRRHGRDRFSLERT